MPTSITVVARVHATEGKAEQLQALLIEQVAAVRKAEPGCLNYRLHRSDTDRNLFYFYEEYKDEAALKAHQTGTHLIAYRERRVAEGLTQGAVEVEVFTPLTT